MQIWSIVDPTWIRILSRRKKNRFEEVFFAYIENIMGQTVETLKIGLGMWGGGEEAQKV